MDLSSLYSVGAKAVSESNPYKISGEKQQEDMFATVFQTALDNIKETNALLSDAENEEIKFMLGETESTHDLMISLQKASTALQYTIAIRDQFVQAYKEIMQMQI